MWANLLTKLLELLQSFVPWWPKECWVRSFQQLCRPFSCKRAFEVHSSLGYPYSTRECVAIVKHLQKFPQDSVQQVGRSAVALNPHTSLSGYGECLLIWRLQPRRRGGFFFTSSFMLYNPSKWLTREQARISKALSSHGIPISSSFWNVAQRVEENLGKKPKLQLNYKRYSGKEVRRVYTLVNVFVSICSCVKAWRFLPRLKDRNTVKRIQTTIHTSVATLGRFVHTKI